MAQSIRTVRLLDWRSDDPATRAGFVRTLGAGLEDLGFVIVTDAGIEPQLLQATYQVAAQTFALPESEKRACEHPAMARQRGYTPFGQEHAKHRNTADLKEFWHVGRPPTAGGCDLPPNVFAPVPEFETTTLALFHCLEAIATDLCAAIGSYLGIDDGVFEALTDGGNSVLRVIHYPPLSDDRPAEAVRAAEHEDINLLTVLPASTATGLEILTRAGTWLAVHPPPGAVVVDTGDMMALLTHGRLPATTHRVVNPSDPELAQRSRYSLPFFLHPRPEARLTPLNDETPGPTAQEFLEKRLFENGVASS